MTRRRTKVTVAAGAAAAAGLALAGPVLDRLVGRVERRLSPVTQPRQPASERAMALHATLRAVDLHADSLLFGRDLLVRGDRGHVDVPRMIEGGVALQVLSAAVKSPRHLNIERNDDRSDDVTSLARGLALAAPHLAEPARAGAVPRRSCARARRTLQRARSG